MVLRRVICVGLVGIVGGGNHAVCTPVTSTGGGHGGIMKMKLLSFWYYRRTKVVEVYVPFLGGVVKVRRRRRWLGRWG